MIDVSQQYKQAYAAGAKISAKVNITLKDSTLLTIYDDEILQNGLSINTATSQPNSFQVGNIVIGQLTLAISNLDGKYNDYDFRGAQIVVYEGLQLTSNNIEYVKKGVFIADRPTISGSAITITAYDNTTKLDKKYESQLTFPASAQSIFIDACEACGIEYKSDFDNSNVIVNIKPTQEGLTYRSVLCFIAQITCNYGICNNEGKFCFSWYDVETLIDGSTMRYDNYGDFSANLYVGGNIVEGEDISEYVDEAQGMSFIEWAKSKNFTDVYTGNYDMWDIEVTGVKVTVVSQASDEEESDTLSYLEGQEGYVIDITDNPCISANDAQSVAQRIYSRVYGFLFRPASVSMQSIARLEAGDCITISDEQGKTCSVILTNVTYVYTGSGSYIGDAETASERALLRPRQSYLDAQRLKQQLEGQIGVIEGRLNSDEFKAVRIEILAVAGESTSATLTAKVYKGSQMITDQSGLEANESLQWYRGSQAIAEATWFSLQVNLAQGTNYSCQLLQETV